MTFNNEAKDNHPDSVFVRQYSQIAIALLMIALESMVKVKLYRINETEPWEIEKLFIKTIDDTLENKNALMFWQELKIIRNNIIHAAFFQSSKEGWSFYIFVDSELSLKLQGNLRKEDCCNFYIS